MGSRTGITITVMDGPTAAVLAQILPVLLLTLVVELRRTALHHKISSRWLGAGFVVFGIIETVLVLSIDGTLYPFQWGDLLSAVAIFSLLALIFVVSFRDPKRDATGDDDL